MGKYHLIFLTLLYSCGAPSSPSKQVAKQNAVDTISNPDFLRFKADFTRNMDGKIDQTRLLPLPYIKSLLGDDIDTTLDKELTPVEFISNRSGYYFIIREKCGAGGDCASYLLMRFDIRGRFVRVEEIGQVTAEDTHSVYFDYKVESDSSLLLYKIDYDADSAVDTIKSRVKLF
jgi:hypothetical protein